MSRFHLFPRSEPAKACLWAGALVFLTAGYYVNVTPGWNVNSQFAMTSAVVERGVLTIDAYHTLPDYETGDKALFGGHYYCDKSPVAPLLAAPPLALYRVVTAAAGLRQTVDFGRYWATWGSVGVAAALTAALLAWALMQRGVPPRAAAHAGALWVAATPLIAYSTVLFPYALADALLLGGFLLAAPAWSGKAPLGTRRLFCAGALLGLAAWTLATSTLVTLCLTIGLLACGLPAERRNAARLRRLIPWALGGFLGVAGHFVYSYALFHSFNLPYAYEADPQFRAQMARGLMGATRPRLLVALMLTLRPYMGLFVWFPFALAAAIGLVALLADRTRAAAMRCEAAMALAGFLAILTYASAYYMWWGGWAYLPRHLLPGMALMGLGLLPWLTARQSRLRRGVLIVGVLGAIVSLSALAFNAQNSIGIPDKDLMELRLPDNWPSPMKNVLRLFWKRGFLQNPNWGTMLGLAGRSSLLPLAALWIAAWALSLRIVGECAPAERRG